MTKMEADIEEIKHKLDLIIRSLGLDGQKTSLDIKHDVDNIVIQLRERRLKKERKKAINKQHVSEAKIRK